MKRASGNAACSSPLRGQPVKWWKNKGRPWAAMRRSNWEGVNAPQLFAGAVGPDAGALGGALLPLHANFAPDRDLFIKEQN